MRQWPFTRRIKPPERVRLEYPDGRVTPVECTYEGVEDGHHVWAAVISVPYTDLTELGATLHVARLPARSLIRMEVTR